MAIKSAQQLVQEAYSEVKTINTDQALALVKDNKCNLIDIRDVNHGYANILNKKEDPNEEQLQN